MQPSNCKSARAAGFTLIELSIVLVIIGLIVGGVLTGQDLIRAAYVRAQITQIEKYNHAVNTFYGKYQALPGDMNAATATTFGFAARGPYAGQGDGNGILEANPNNTPGNNFGNVQGIGETGMFWVDLSQVGLIDGGFNTATSVGIIGPTVSGPSVSQYLPQAKIGAGNFVYVYSGGYGTCGSAGCWTGTGINYYGVSSITNITTGTITSTPGLTVRQAYSIDAKMDDGLPQSGRVLAQFVSSNFNGGQTWAGISTSGDYTVSGWSVGSPTTAAEPGNSKTCYDNNNAIGTTQMYSLAQNGGATVNCALSFVFQ